MLRSQIDVLPEYFDRYINRVDDISILDALQKYGINYLMDYEDKFEKLGDKVYAEGKWTVKEILQHLIDTERIFAYRSLRFARQDKTSLPGYEENDYVINAKVGRRNLDELLSEFTLVRESTIALFDSFDREMLHSRGVCFNKDISVLALGFTMVGHVVHHMQVLEERYFPLIK